MALYVWGHNNSQQLGLDATDKDVFEMRQVETLRNEVIVDFSAGERHSLALNEFGQVFAWGRGREGQLGLGDVAGVASEVPLPRRVGGALAGQLVTKISCGESHSLALTVSGDVFMWGLLPVAKVLQDEDGVATDASDRATVELAGLSSEEMREAQRTRSRAELRRHMDDNIMARLVRDSMQVYEDAGVVDGENVKVQTVRAPCVTPRVATGPLARLVVTNIAAGFAHSLATTSDGSVFSCGYNDNGQLGLGSRRNSAEFQRVRALEGYFIDQIACGQQHSLACSRITESAGGSEDEPTTRSGVCFSWGLGVLGQLGTGTNKSWLPQEVKLARPVVSVAAGSHHSVAVTDDGKVYTWGHSEYGQHGAGETFYDLQQNAHYFFPRVQQALADDPRIKVVRACCSSHSTFALTRDGSVMSWGWNAFGVLGNGKYQHSVHPQRVFGLKDNVAVAVGAGSNHCAVAVRPRGAHYSLSYDRVLANGDFADLVFIVGGPTKVERIKAHRVVVSARSSYIRGLLRVLDVVAKDTQEARDDGKIAKEEGFVVDEFQDVDAQLFRAFLVFLYTNRLDVVSHKRKALGQFASRVCCDALVIQCLDTWRKERLASLPPPSFRCLGQHLSGSEPNSSEAQQFGEDMKSMVLSEEVADVVFLWPIEESDPETFERLPAHKAVLSQVEYFRTMFMGGFSEGKTAQGATTVAGSESSSKRAVHEIPLHYMHRDGVSLEAFKGLLLWIYTGCFELLSARLEPSDMMDLFVGASLLGLTVLASRCELQLIELLPQLDVDSLRACEDFAERYDARRLQTMSQQVLRKQLPVQC
ncbi:Regulator of chromosome condensation (RCC1)-like protein [Phytophthora palmivora]|uniref:Regulator of chromosome condensation (RCC1)-like protein n=1 Tax=Phytophthora palmivora TaxID=4796 RepID=A0A2P4XDL7_9STRA|nr:Regulator of chromosome condensation (RCC1)-like protein [Phytophthora palmivora]